MTKTHDLGFASGGAVSQDGPLPIRECKRCGEQIVWAKSNRTGNNYPVNISTGYMHQRFYVKSDVHNCDEVESKREANRIAAAEQAEKEAKGARNIEILKQVQALGKTIKAEGKNPGDSAEWNALLESMEG